MSGAGVGLVASPTPDMSSGKADHMWLPWRRTREGGGGGGGGGHGYRENLTDKASHPG